MHKMSPMKCWLAKLLTVCMVTRVEAQRSSAFEQYPPLDYNDPSSPDCEDKVAQDDCVRLLANNLYQCDDFTDEQKKLCQGTCNLCGMFDEEEPEPESLPPQPAIDISKATNDDFIEVDNSDNDYGVDGIMPNHGQVPAPAQGASPPMMPVPHPGMVPGMYPAAGMYPGYPYPQPGYPYGHMPHVPPYVPPASKIPAKGKPGQKGVPPPFALPPGESIYDDEPENPDGAIRDGAANVNVPVLGGKTLPGMLLPLWAVILICFGIIILLIFCCWFSVKIHSCWLRRSHRRDVNRIQKDTDVTVAQLKTELASMKKLANERQQIIDETKECGVDVPSNMDVPV